MWEKLALSNRNKKYKRVNFISLLYGEKPHG